MYKATHRSPVPKGAPLPEAERVLLARHTRRCGEQLLLAVVEVSRQTLARALGGLTLYPGTRALIRQGLAKLEDAELRIAEAERLGGVEGGER